MSQFWLKNPSVLFDSNRIYEIIPTNRMVYYEKLNAISRFVIYTSLIAFMLKGNTMSLGLMIVALILISILSFRDVHDFARTIANDGIAIEHLPLSETSATNCKMPTKNNPMMNNLLSDYRNEDGDATEAFLLPCNLNDEKIKKNAKEKFNENLFKDLSFVGGANDDVPRQFFTMPSGGLSRQGEFASWLYGRDEVCKGGDTEACTGHN